MASNTGDRGNGHGSQSLNCQGKCLILNSLSTYYTELAFCLRCYIMELEKIKVVGSSPLNEASFECEDSELTVLPMKPGAEDECTMPAGFKSLA